MLRRLWSPISPPDDAFQSGYHSKKFAFDVTTSPLLLIFLKSYDGPLKSVRLTVMHY